MNIRTGKTRPAPVQMTSNPGALPALRSIRDEETGEDRIDMLLAAID